MAYDVTALNAWTKEFTDVLYMNCIAKGITVDVVRSQGGIVLDQVKQTGAIPVGVVDSSTILSDGSSCNETPAGTVDLSSVSVTVAEYSLLMKMCQRDFHGTSAEITLPAGSDYDSLGAWENQILGLIVSAVSERQEVLVWQSDTAGAGDLALMDGYEKQISDAITATTIPAAQSLAGSVAKADILATVEAMTTAVPATCLADAMYRGNLVFLTSPTNVLTYTQAYKDAFGSATYTSGANNYVIEDSLGAPIVGVPGISGNRIVLANVGNMIIAADVAGEENSVMVSPGTGSELNSLFISGAFKLGVGFKDISETVVNGF